MRLSKRRVSSTSKGMKVRELNLEALEMRAVPATVSGRLFHDWDGNGTQAAVGEVGLAGWNTYIDVNGNGSYDGASGGTDFPSGTVNITIPTTVSTVTSDIVVSGSGLGTVADVDVTINITHTWDSDLDIFLVNVDTGNQVELTTDNGGSADNYTNTTFDDEAGTLITAGVAPFTGSFRPESPLSFFDGYNVDGTWQLKVMDDASGDGGTLVSWSLKFNAGPAEPSANTTSTGDYTLNSVPVGTYNQRLVVPAGWNVVAPAAGIYPVTIVTAGDALTGNNFAVAQQNAIYGKTFEDFDGSNTYNAGDVALSGRFVYLDTNNNGAYDGAGGGTTFSSGTVNLAIPDSPNPGITNDIVVAGSGLGNVTDINVTLNITHTFDGDLDIFISYNGGTPVELSTDNGGSGDNYTNTSLDDQASTSITLAVAPMTGTFKPEGLLSTFNGVSVDGTWTISITDDAGGDLGTLVDWAVTFNGAPPEPSTVSDANGNFVFTGLTAGTYYVRHNAGAGYNTTVPATNLYTRVLASNDTSFSNNFGEVQPSAIYGTVYNDLDGNGAQNGVEAGIANVVVYQDANNNEVRDGEVGGTTFSSGAVNIAIPDSPNPGITNDIVVAGSGLGNVTDLNVTLNITHTFDSDLDIFISYNGGTPVELSTDNGSSGDNFTNTVFSDQAITSITVGVAPMTGTFRPEGLLSSFNGVSVDGTWTISITDDAATDIGTLVDWSVTFNSSAPEVGVTTNAAGHYTFTGVAPGVYNIRQSPILGSSWTQPVSGVYPVTITGTSTSFANNFGNFAEAVGPTITDVVDVTPDPRATAVASVDVVASELLNLATITPADFALTLDGNPVTFSGNETVTHVSGNTYSLNGLTEETGTAGVYVLTIDAAGVTDTAGNAGSGTTSDTWTFAAGDVVAPTVTGLFIDGSSWTTAFRTAAGNATYGYPAQTGAGQLTTMPWSTINRFNVTFSEPVTALTLPQVGVRGVNVGTYVVSSVTALSTSEYQINVAGPIDTDWLILDVDGSAATGVKDLAGNALAGTFTENASTFPTTGAAGVNFKYRFKVTVGDADRNNIVRNADKNLVTANLFVDAGMAGYNIYADTNADGIVRNVDKNIVNAHLFVDGPGGGGPSRPRGQATGGNNNGGTAGRSGRFATTSLVEAASNATATRRMGSQQLNANVLDQLFAEV